MMGAPSLDHKRINRNKACSGRTLKSVHTNGNGEKEFVYKRLFCKKWSCKRCGPIKAWQACRDIPKFIKEKSLNRFLTLTLDPKKVPEDINVHKYIWKVWAKFRTYLKRKLKEKISYICVLELHKSGMPHLHILVNRFIPQSWISNSWSAVGGGKIVFIEKIKDAKRIGYYLSKYLTKNIDAILPRRLRRITSSRDIKLNKFDKGETKWEMSPISMEMIEKSAGTRDVIKKHDNNEILTEIRSTYNLDHHEELDSDVWNVIKEWIAEGKAKNNESNHVSESIEQGTKRTRLLYRSPEEIAPFVRKEYWDSYCERVRRYRNRKEGGTNPVQSIGLFFEKEQGNKSSPGGENRQTV